MKKMIYLFSMVLMIAGLTDLVFADKVSKNPPITPYLYVCGPDVSRYDGADPEDNQQIVFFDVPQSQAEAVTIEIFDPDTGGKLDQKSSKEKKWETLVEFAVYGKEDALLEKKTFDDSAQYDMKYYSFGPFPKEMGQQTGQFHRFKLVVRPIKTYLLRGEELDLFRVRVYPQDVQTFSNKIFFRLSPNTGEQICFYPEIPAGVSEISVENYDIDPDGGSAVLYDPIMKKNYKISDSESGTWSETKIELGASDLPRRLEYIITKKTQQYGNAAIRVKDLQGNLLPIYFAESVTSQKIPEIIAALAAVEEQKAKKAEVEYKSQESIKKTKPETSVLRVASASTAVKKEKAKVQQVPVKKSVPKAADSKIKSAERPKETGSACNKFTFDATASYDPNNEKLTYFWDFGDGSTSTDPIVTHIFEKGGKYNVSLSVKDTSGLNCDTATTTQIVNVNTPPVPAFSALETACVNEAVVFDASATTDDTPANITYFWDFGDATSAESKVVTKKYERGGVYTVKLTVNDNANTACSIASIYKNISVNTPPIAQAGEDITLCLPPDKDCAVVFDASKSNDADGDKLAYTWDFGDGESSQSKSVTHVYKSGGTYTAKLTVDDGRGLACSKSDDTVMVNVNRQPVAIAGENKVTCLATEVFFDGSASYDPDDDWLTYAWDFGDGSTAEGWKVKHVYEQAGNYKVMLMVDDGIKTSCSTAISSLNVFVNKPPVAALEKVEPVCLGSKVELDASKTVGTNIEDYEYTWDFGDGTTVEAGMKTSHQYSKGGKYSVKVTVDDRLDTPCSTDSATTEVLVNTPPQAKAVPLFACCVDTESVFDGSESFDADKDALSYLWDFGDGSTAQGQKVTHKYAKGGVYTVTLEVNDNSQTACSSSRDSFDVRINDQPIAVIKVR